MDLIDTHCHLGHGRLRQKVDAVLDRARGVGVDRLICAAGTVHESRVAAALAGEHPGVFCLAGVHPHEARNVMGPEALAAVEQLAAHERNVAIGEIGLDYHYDFSPREDQQRVFAEQLALAERLGKAVVIHTREALADTLAILAESAVDPARIVFHSCTQGPEGMRQLLDLGATISFSGIVTFRQTGDLRQAAELVPDERILVETDAPFLSPEPVRKQKTNEPANVAHVAACLAGVRKVSPERLAEQTTANAVRFFGLDT